MIAPRLQLFKPEKNEKEVFVWILNDEKKIKLKIKKEKSCLFSILK